MILEEYNRHPKKYEFVEDVERRKGNIRAALFMTGVCLFFVAVIGLCKLVEYFFG